MFLTISFTNCVRIEILRENINFFDQLYLKKLPARKCYQTQHAKKAWNSMIFVAKITYEVLYKFCKKGDSKTTNSFV